MHSTTFTPALSAALRCCLCTAEAGLLAPALLRGDPEADAGDLALTGRLLAPTASEGLPQGRAPIPIMR